MEGQGGREGGLAHVSISAHTTIIFQTSFTSLGHPPKIIGMNHDIEKPEALDIRLVLTV